MDDVTIGSVWVSRCRRHKGQRRRVIRVTPTTVVFEAWGPGPGHHRGRRWSLPKARFL